MGNYGGTKSGGQQGLYNKSPGVSAEEKRLDDTRKRNNYGY